MPPPGLSSRTRGNTPGYGLKFWLVLSIGVLPLGGYLLLQRHLNATQQQWDSATLCPVSGPTAVHAFLIDRSDPISQLQATRLRQKLLKIIEEAKVGERIDMYVAESDGAQTLQPLVSVCNPGSEANELYQNPRRMRQRYESAFERPIEKALQKTIEPSSMRTSPIIESIKAVCVESFGDLRPNTPANLLIASDMIQNTKVLNQYRPYSFEAFVGTAGYAETLVNCHSADISILYLMRPDSVKYQGRAHQFFWEKLLERDNARVLRIEAI